MDIGSLAVVVGEALVCSDPCCNGSIGLYQHPKAARGGVIASEAKQSPASWGLLRRPAPRNDRETLTCYDLVAETATMMYFVLMHRHHR
jgi:hypothetical protein